VIVPDATPAVTVIDVVVNTSLLAAAGLTVNVWPFDIPPPGEGLRTVMLKVPAVVRSLAGIDAVNCVELTNVVVVAEPLNCTTELLLKLVPFTVRVNVAEPTFLLVGEMLVVVGTGLLAMIVSVCDAADPPRGVTVIFGLPAAVSM
jgi:hypothetical protein